MKASVHKPQLNLFDSSAKYEVEQAWAEMLHLYHELGSLPVVLSRELASDALQEQVEASQDDARIGQIEAWLDMRMPHEKVCVVQICQEALGIERQHQKQWQQNDVRDIMERHFPEWKCLGKKARIGIYGVQRAWTREEAR